MTRTRSAWCLVGALAIGAGCTRSIHSDNRTAGNTKVSGADAQVQVVEIGDASLASTLTYENAMTRDEGGILCAQAQLRNQTPDSIHAQYRVTWYDANGWEMRDASSLWMPFVANGKELVALNAKAPSPGAAKFRFTVRRDVAAR